MREFLVGHYAYLFIAALLVIGLYGVLTRSNLVKKLIGLTIMQSAIILIWVASASKPDGTVPVLSAKGEAIDITAYMNPLPHTLMLTAIVVGVATLGVAFALLVSIHRKYGTLEETELLQRMTEDSP